MKKSSADYVRSIGVQVGDTIQGLEQWPNGWTVTRLTLLWLGEEIAVWRSVSRGSWSRNWTKPKETANWDLGCRDWQILPPGGE
jgi:hypothetical protein